MTDHAEQIKSGHYSIVTVTQPGHPAQLYVVLERAPAKARRIAQKWVAANLPPGCAVGDVTGGSSFYGNNRIAERCLSDGYVIEAPHS